MYLYPDLMVFGSVANYTRVLNCQMVSMSMVGMHKLDYRNDVDPAETVDRQYIGHARFQSSNYEHCVDNKVE